MNPTGRPAAAVLVALLVSIFVACDSPQNPFLDPGNVDLSLTLSVDADTGVCVGDTLWVYINVYLPYLLGTVTVEVGDSAYPLIMPTDNNEVDLVDSLSHVFVHPGTYMVRALAERTDGASLIDEMEIAVAGAPPRIVFSPDTIRLAEGSDGTVSVVATGTIPVEYTWTHADTVLDNGSSTLDLTSVSPGTGGEYRCIVSSDWGADTSEAIIVDIQPVGWVAAPENLYGVMSDSGLVLHWQEVSGAHLYRVYAGATALDPAAAYVIATSIPHLIPAPPETGFVWVRAVRDTMVSAPSPALPVADAVPVDSNAAPYWSVSQLTVETAEGESIRIALDSICHDADPGDTLRFDSDDAPAFVEIVHGDLVVTPGNRDACSNVFCVQASDGVNQSVLAVHLQVQQKHVHLSTESEHGTVTVHPDSTVYRWGDWVTLTAVASTPYQFGGWAGDTASSADSLCLMLVADTTRIVALYEFAEGTCIPIQAGTSLNEALQSISHSDTRPARLCPEPGRYEEGTVAIHGTVEFIVE